MIYTDSSTGPQHQAFPAVMNWTLSQNKPIFPHFCFCCQSVSLVITSMLRCIPMLGVDMPQLAHGHDSSFGTLSMWVLSQSVKSTLTPPRVQWHLSCQGPWERSVGPMWVSTPQQWGLGHSLFVNQYSEGCFMRQNKRMNKTCPIAGPWGNALSGRSWAPDANSNLVNPHPKIYTFK